MDNSNPSSTVIPIDKNAEFVDSSQLKDQRLPPIKPFVGVLKDWSMSKIKFVPTQGDQAGKEVVTTRLILVVDPKTMAFPYYNGDHPESNGCVLVQWNVSQSPNSVYGINMEQMNLLVEGTLVQFGEKDLLAAGRYIVTDGKDKGKTKFRVLPKHFAWMIDNAVPYLWGSKDPETYTALGKFKPKEHQRVMLALAPEGWEANIPFDLDEQKSKAVIDAKARWESRQAGKSASNGTSASSVTLATDVSLGDAESLVLAFLNGKKKADLIFAVADTDLPEAIKEGLYADTVQGQLIAAGKLTLADGVYARV